MGIVIEGIETEEQRVLLRLAGCNEMQGYLFARPMPARRSTGCGLQRRSGRGAVPMRATG